VQNENGSRERGNVDHAKCSVRLSNPDFSYARADAGHWLPVIGIVTFLHLEELKASSSPGRRRER
jgi:hypothetical protein